MNSVMKNPLIQFSVADIRRANEKMKERNASSGRFKIGEIKLTAGVRSKIISTKVNRLEMQSAMQKAMQSAMNKARSEAIARMNEE